MDIVQNNTQSGNIVCDCIVIRECLINKGVTTFKKSPTFEAGAKLCGTTMVEKLVEKRPGDGITIGSPSDPNDLNLCGILRVDLIEEKTTGSGVTITDANFTGTVDLDVVCVSDKVQTDLIEEKTAGSGVTIDGVLVKDGGLTLSGTLETDIVCVGDKVQTDLIEEKTLDAGVTIDGVLVKDGGLTLSGTLETDIVCANTKVQTDLIEEKTLDAGVTIDGVLVKDGGLTLTGDIAADVVCANTKVQTDFIEEKTAGSGVTIDGALIKDGNVFVDGTDAVEVMVNKDVANGYAGLDSMGKVPIANLSAQPLIFKGCWDASTNMPALASGVGTDGDYYIVCVAGTSTLDGVSSWAVGDALVFSVSAGNKWVKLPGTGAVASVNGMTGVVVLNLDDINDVTLTSLATNEGICWNGSQWVNQLVVKTVDGLSPDASGNVDFAAANAITVTPSGSTVTIGETHSALTNNPHSVTAAQVGNSTAQWNADKLQGSAVLDFADDPNSNAAVLGWDNTAKGWTVKSLLADTAGAIVEADGSLTIKNCDPEWNAKELQGFAVSASSPSTGDLLVWNGSAWTPTAQSDVFPKIVLAAWKGSATAPTTTTENTTVPLVFNTEQVDLVSFNTANGTMTIASTGFYKILFGGIATYNDITESNHSSIEIVKDPSGTPTTLRTCKLDAIETSPRGSNQAEFTVTWVGMLTAADPLVIRGRTGLLGDRVTFNDYFICIEKMS